MSRTVFLAWQDPSSRRWFPVGRLSSNDRRYLFVYTQGALAAKETGGFHGLTSFPDLGRVYQSDRLFPLFSNRLLRTSRPDYPDYLEWLGLSGTTLTPSSSLLILARSGGTRATDMLQIFALPEEGPGSTYEMWFFVHGLSHFSQESRERAERLVPGERLLLMWDFQNPKDADALALRTVEATPGDLNLVGYCPRFLCAEIRKLMQGGDNPPVVTVERTNLAPAPSQFRVLCRLQMKWKPGFRPFAEKAYEPLLKGRENKAA